MITADEARNLMPKRDILKNDYPELNKLVMSAAEEGYSSIEYSNVSDISCFDRLIKALIELGYSCEITWHALDSFNNRIKYILKIEW